MYVKWISWFTNHRPPCTWTQKDRGLMVLHVFYHGPSRTHAHNRRCSVQKGGSEGKVVRRWSSRPCWERWPVPGLPAPAGGVSSAALVLLSRFPASPTPSAGLHSQTGPEKQEHATLRAICPKLGIAQWCESLWSSCGLNWSVQCFALDIKFKCTKIIHRHIFAYKYSYTNNKSLPHFTNKRHQKH